MDSGDAAVYNGTHSAAPRLAPPPVNKQPHSTAIGETVSPIVEAWPFVRDSACGRRRATFAIRRKQTNEHRTSAIAAAGDIDPLWECPGMQLPLARRPVLRDSHRPRHPRLRTLRLRGGHAFWDVGGHCPRHAPA